MNTRPSTASSGPASPAVRRSAATVYFDGACPLCRREIGFFRRRALAGSLVFEDVSAWDAHAEHDGLDRDRAMRRFHVRLASGELVSGARGFAALWRVTPGLRLLGRMAEWPPLTRLLDRAYLRFLEVRPWLQRRLSGGNGVGHCAATCAPSRDSEAFPNWLWQELRSDHAGEAGAVQIYRGILALSRDAEVRDFAMRHVATEARHLSLIEAIVPPERRSRLLALWRAAGWITGALPALLGARAVYHTIDAVETFVDRHYGEQIDALDALGAHQELRGLLADCREDEVAHRDEARETAGTPPGPVGKLWQATVEAGSRVGVALARRV